MESVGKDFKTDIINMLKGLKKILRVLKKIEYKKEEIKFSRYENYI